MDRRPMGLVQLVTTIDRRDRAVDLARAVVGERMAACVQVIGPITSVYRWEGKLEEATEFLCVMKVPSDGVQRLAAFVRGRHPFDTPEITAVESSFVDERYLAWARAETVAEVRP